MLQKMTKYLPILFSLESSSITVCHVIEVQSYLCTWCIIIRGRCGHRLKPPCPLIYFTVHISCKNKDTIWGWTNRHRCNYKPQQQEGSGHEIRFWAETHFTHEGDWFNNNSISSPPAIIALMSTGVSTEKSIAWSRKQHDSTAVLGTDAMQSPLHWTFLSGYQW